MRTPSPPGALLGTAILAWSVGVAAAQEGAPVLDGRVLEEGEPVAGASVILHRVGMDTAGAVDSVRAAADGTFTFRLPAIPGTEEGRGGIYFASVRHRGVLYFGSPVNDPAVLDSAYTIEVHDTLVAPEEGAELALPIRHLIVDRPGDAWQVTDLLQIRNEGGRTYVAGEGGTTFTYPLPPGTRDFEVGRSDLSPEAATLVGHTLSVSSPIPPGERLFVFRYAVGAEELAVPVGGRVGRLEVLVRESAPALDVTGLRAGEPVDLEGTTYRRYAASDISGTTVRIRLGEAGGSERIPGGWIAVALAAILAGGALFALRRSGPEPAPAGAGAPAGARATPEGGGGSLPRSREALLREIALLDEEFADEELGEEEEARYRHRREALKDRLRALERG